MKKISIIISGVDINIGFKLFCFIENALYIKSNVTFITRNKLEYICDINKLSLISNLYYYIIFKIPNKAKLKAMNRIILSKDFIVALDFINSFILEINYFKLEFIYNNLNKSIIVETLLANIINNNDLLISGENIIFYYFALEINDNSGYI